MQPSVETTRRAGPGVSILTGLERPVQPAFPARRFQGRGVSILTGLERPVQHAEGNLQQARG